MKKVLIILIAVVAVLGGGYFLLKDRVPTLSQLIFKQIDLGTSESSDMIYEYLDEIGFVSELKGDEPKSGDLEFTGEIRIEKVFTEQEMNSFASSWKDWAGSPFTDVQVKIYEDGTAEASASISIQGAENIAKTLGYTDEEISEAKKYLKYVPDPLPMYATGTAYIENNVIEMDLSNMKIAGVNLPGDLPNQVGNVIEDMGEKAIETMAPQTVIESAKVTEEGIDVQGTFPSAVGIKSE